MIARAHRRTAGSTDEEHDFAPAVYGSLLVTTLVAVQWRHDASTDLIALSLLTSVAVFWLAHAWSEIVDRRVRGPIGIRDAATVAGGEASILTAAIVPALLLGLPRVSGVSVDQAIGLALIASIVQLFLWGLVVGRAAHGSWPFALGIAIVDCGLGILVVVLKVVVIH
jgi:hypothetical protein